MRSGKGKGSGLLLLALLLMPCATSAQSLFSTRGLGVPMEGYDARARGLGVSGVGLIGLSTSMLNPAEQAGYLRRGVSATFQPWSASVNVGGEAGKVGGTRFPMFTVMYPTRRFLFTFGFSGLLDQSWAITSDRSQVLGGDTLTTRDVLRSVGGIGELKFGVARALSERFALGASFGWHTGQIERITRREFPDSSLLGFENKARWDYTGVLGSVGFRWDPNRSTRVGASVTWSGDVDARPKQGSTSNFTYKFPMRFAAGASNQLTSKLLVAVSTTISSYGTDTYTAPPDVTPTVAEKTVQWGGGLEWQQLKSGSRIFPLRVGYRSTKLPFHNVGEAAGKEWAASGGIGFRLVEDEAGPLAVGDIGFERGKRTGWSSTSLPAGLSESFWRFSASISIFGR